jgi:hypothetical protein
MTRKLVDVAQDVIIRGGLRHGQRHLGFRRSYEGEDEVVKLSERIVGRVSCDDINNPTSPQGISWKRRSDRRSQGRQGHRQRGIERVRIRSVLTCESKHGICAKCYGTQPGDRRLEARRGGRHHRRAVHRRTRHAAHHAYVPHRRCRPPACSSSRRSRPSNDGTVSTTTCASSKARTATTSFSTRTAPSAILADDGRELESYTVVIGSVISVKDGGKVKKGETFVQWDPYNVPILSEKAGKVKFHDIIEGVTMKQEWTKPPARKPWSSSSTRKICTRRSSSSDDKGEVVANYSDSVRRAHRRQRRRQDRPRPAADRQDAAQDRQDQGHHRRSAARGRAVRSPPSEGRGGNLQDRRHRRLRRRASAASASFSSSDPVHARGRGASHPARQARHRLQGRRGQEGPAAHRRSGGSRTKSSRSADRRNCRNIWSTKCRKFTASRA